MLKKILPREPFIGYPEIGTKVQFHHRNGEVVEGMVTGRRLWEGGVSLSLSCGERYFSPDVTQGWCSSFLDGDGEEQIYPRKRADLVVL